MNIASSCKTTLYFSFRNDKLIAVVVNFERLYDKASGVDRGGGGVPTRVTANPLTVCSGEKQRNSLLSPTPAGQNFTNLTAPPVDKNLPYQDSGNGKFKSSKIKNCGQYLINDKCRTFKTKAKTPTRFVVEG